MILPMDDALFSEAAKEFLALAERALDDAMPKAGTRPAPLTDAVRYAVGAGGKRVRPILCLASAVAAGGDAADAAPAAAAIELLHNYTLVHDDLPSMDNDAERRGKPSVWAKFGEANAILAADALQALAFAAAAKSPRNAEAVVAALAEAGYGVVAGQVEDIAKSGDVDFVYEHKTADLFIAAAAMGGLAAGGLPEAIAALRAYALNLGLAFQYADDLLDGDSPLGRDETQRRVSASTSAALAALDSLPGDASFLSALALRLSTRKK